MRRNFNRESTREMQTLKYTHRCKVGVFGMCSSVGSTFITTGLSYIGSCKFPGTTGFVGISDFWRHKANPLFSFSYVYDSLAMDYRFANRGFVDLFREAEFGNSLHNIKNIDDSINWALPVPSYAGTRDLSSTSRHNSQNMQGYEPKLSPPESDADPLAALYSTSANVINNLSADFVFVDMGNFSGINFLSVFAREFDILVYVMDPLPSRLIAGFEGFSETRKMELHGKKVIYVLNKSNPGISKREISSYLKFRDFTDIELIDPALIYQAEFSGKIPLSYGKIKEQLLPAFTEIYTRIIS